MFGLGPALTQRVPFFAILAAGSWLVGGPLATKVVVVVLLAAGFVGAGRLVAPDGRSACSPRSASGVCVGGGALRRHPHGAGHLNLLWAVAVLPWVLPRLCRPSSSVSRTFLAVLLLAVGGPAAGTLGARSPWPSAWWWSGSRRCLRPAVAIGVPPPAWCGWRPRRWSCGRGPG